MKSNGVIEAVIFDLDGLLVDSEPVQIEAWNQYLDQFGLTVNPSLVSKMYGRRLIDTSQAVVDEFNLDCSPEEVASARDALFLELARGSISAKDGAREIIEQCAECRLGLALATSGHRQYVEIALESAGLKGLFDVQITSDLVARGKPAPDTFLTAATHLGVAPSDCLVLEDSPNGVRAAVAARMRCIAIPDQPGHEDGLGQADAVVASLSDVMPIIRDRGWIQE